MAKNQAIYEERGISLFGIIFKLSIYSIFLSISFIAGGVFLNNSFRVKIKSSPYYQEVLAYSYFKKLDREATPKPKIVEKQVEKIVEKVVRKTPKKETLGYQELKPNIGIDNFEKVENLNSFKRAKKISHENNNSRNGDNLSLFEKVRDKINTKNISDSNLKNNNLVLDNNSKASLDVSKAKVTKLKEEQKEKREEGDQEVIQNQVPVLNEEELIEVKPEIKVTPLAGDIQNLIESKAQIAKLDPINTKKLIFNLAKFKIQYGLDPVFITAIMMKESSLNPEAISANGKLGIFQIHPLKAKNISEYAKVELRKGVSLIDLDYNMSLGAGYINFLNRMFKGNKKHILTAYYMGIEKFINAAKNKRKLSNDVIDYRDDILGMYEQWSASNREVKKVNTKQKKVVNKSAKGSIRDYLSSKGKNKTRIRDPFKTKNVNSSKGSSKKLKLPKIKIVN